MQRHAAWGVGKSQEYTFLGQQSSQAAFLGQMKKARELTRRALELAQRRNMKGTAANILVGEAVREADLGNQALARERATAALAIPRTPDTMLPAASMLVLLGQTAQAEKTVAEVAQHSPSDTLLNAIGIPVARANIELSRNNPAKAIEFLQAAAPYDRRKSGVLYVRGTAYLQARQGREATAEFQRILDNRGWAPLFYTYSLAHLGLARAAALTGDTAKSRKAYQDFLAIWKDADPAIPLLQQAKTEYAALK